MTPKPIGQTPDTPNHELAASLKEHAEVVLRIEDESDRRLLERISTPGYPVTPAQVKWAQSLLVKGNGRSFKHWPQD